MFNLQLVTTFKNLIEFVSCFKGDYSVVALDFMKSLKPVQQLYSRPGSSSSDSSVGSASVISDESSSKEASSSSKSS